MKHQTTRPMFDRLSTTFVLIFFLCLNAAQQIESGAQGFLHDEPMHAYVNLAAAAATLMAAILMGGRAMALRVLKEKKKVAKKTKEVSSGTWPPPNRNKWYRVEVKEGKRVSTGKAQEQHDGRWWVSFDDKRAYSVEGRQIRLLE